MNVKRKFTIAITFATTQMDPILAHAVKDFDLEVTTLHVWVRFVN